MRKILDSLKNQAMKELSENLTEEYKKILPIIQTTLEGYNEFIAKNLEDYFNRKINQIIYLVLNESDEVKDALLKKSKLNKIEIEHRVGPIDRVKFEGRII